MLVNNGMQQWGMQQWGTEEQPDTLWFLSNNTWILQLNKVNLNWLSSYFYVPNNPEVTTIVYDKQSNKQSSKIVFNDTEVKREK